MLALGLAAGQRTIPGRLLLAGLVCSVLPDMDVVGFMMKVSYGDTMGHRGAATNGGLGVAVFWPWNNTRYFLPWQPIEVSPFSPRRLFSTRGMKILFSELTWVWLPSFAAALFIFTLRKNLKQRFT